MFVLMGLSTENSENYQSSSIVRETREKEREKEWIYAWEQNRGRDEGERRLTSVSIKMSTGDKVCSTKRRRRGFHYFPSLFLHDEFFSACKRSINGPSNAHVIRTNIPPPLRKRAYPLANQDDAMHTAPPPTNPARRTKWAWAETAKFVKVFYAKYPELWQSAVNDVIYRVYHPIIHTACGHRMAHRYVKKLSNSQACCLA